MNNEKRLRAELADEKRQCLNAIGAFREQKRMALSLADRVYAAHEVLAKVVERRPAWDGTEADYPTE